MAVSVAPDLPDQQDAHQTIAFVQELFNEASRAKRALIPQWNRYYRLSRNRAWSEYRASWLPSPSSSEIFPTLHSLASYMTAQRPRLFPTPYLEDEQVQVDPQVLGEKAEQMKLTLESWWTTSKAARACRMSIWDMLTFGAGCLKTGWDPSLHDGLGDATVRRVDPYNLLPDPTASCEDDLRYMLEASEVPVYELKLRFPRTAHLVDGSASPDLYHLDRRPDMRGDYEVVPQGQLAGIQRTGEFPGTATTGIPSRFTWPGAGYRKEDFTRKVRLVECWIRESDTVTIPVITGPDEVEEMSVEVPTWRFVAIAGGKLLTDMDNPFPHNQLPYVRIPYVETGEFWPPPLVEHLDRAQIALNRLLASLQMNIELAGNPILVDQAQSGLSRTRISNRPGGRLTEQVPGAIRWLQPPSVSGEMLAAVQNWRESIDRTSGISAVTRGEALRRREPASAVDTAHEAAQTRIGDVLTNLEEALRRLANQTAANIGQWYIEPRQIPVAGARGGPNMLELPPKAFRYPIVEGTKVRDVPISFEVWIEAGSSLPLSHQARVAEAMSLFFAGLLDPRAVHEIMDLPGWKGIVERLEAAPPPPNPRRR